MAFCSNLIHHDFLVPSGCRVPGLVSLLFWHSVPSSFPGSFWFWVGACLPSLLAFCSIIIPGLVSLLFGHSVPSSFPGSFWFWVGFRGLSPYFCGILFHHHFLVPSPFLVSLYLGIFTSEPWLGHSSHRNLGNFGLENFESFILCEPLFGNIVRTCATGTLTLLGNLYLMGTFTWEPLLANLKLGTFAWEPLLGKFAGAGTEPLLYSPRFAWGSRPRRSCFWSKHCPGCSELRFFPLWDPPNGCFFLFSPTWGPPNI